MKKIRSMVMVALLVLSACVLTTCAPPPVVVTTGPISGGIAGTATPAVVIGMRPTSATESTLTPATVLPSPTAASRAEAGAAAREYMVQTGDTLLGLAIAFDVPMAAIQLQNDLGTETTVKVGNVLVIPSNAAWAGASPFWVLYQVREGEVLSTIAAAYGLDVDKVLRVNNLSNANLITVGQLLVLPLDAPEDFAIAENRPTATPRPPDTATPVPPTVTPTSAEPVSVTIAPPSTAVAPIATLAPTSPPSDDMAAIAWATLDLLNAERAAHDLPPLAWNGILAQAAELHVTDCYDRGYCGHTGSDGSTMKERILRAGYDPVRWSECWAWSTSANLAVAAWMDETPPNDPHRRTILSDYLTEVGIGVMPGNGHGYYFIADFGTPRE